MFKIDRVGPVESATTAFGQGVSVTPIQQVAQFQLLLMEELFTRHILQKN